MKKITHLIKHYSSFVGLVLFSFVLGWYGFNCVSEKVCPLTRVDTAIRHHASITLPLGTIDAEIADTRSSRELGLSGRTSLPKDTGMLFIFDTPGRYGFWMKDMLFPLDMVWINKDGVVVKIEENAKPEDYPVTYINDPEASYVLEINAHTAESYGLFLGTKVTIQK